MPTSISVPETWVAAVGRLSLPPQTDRRLRVLMERNSEGMLTDPEREDLEALVEWSESISLVRAGGAPPARPTPGMSVPPRLAEQVRTRAYQRREYCRMAQDLPTMSLDNLHDRAVVISADAGI